MPMREEDYPENWKEISLAIRVERAKNCCEQCGVKNGAVIRRHLGAKFTYATGCDKIWIAYLKTFKSPVNGYTLRLWWILQYLGLTKVVLTVAHLDRNPANNDPDNLRALCQRCHICYDIPQHVRSRKFGRDHHREHQFTLFES